ncbi:MAG: hypothetical protein JNM68_09520, partial [Dinghuibacter sp.]|nr:hypothetical protein [Dinghuibacter sp.]
ISLGTLRNPGFYAWSDAAYGMELHNLLGKWGLGIFARTDSDIRLGHYTSGQTAQSNLAVKMLIQNDGKVGIGTNTPLELLHVRGSVMAENSAAGASSVRNSGFYTWEDRAYGMELHNNGSKWGLAVFARTDSDIRFGHYSGNQPAQSQLNTKMIIAEDGKVSIGNVSAAPAGYKLYVENGILTEKVKVAVKTSADWADFVFDEQYPLRPINELEQFVRKNKHLPGIPSAGEMVKQGNDLGRTDALLLQKIEELSLYIISLQKQLAQQQKEISQLKNK